MASWYDIYGAAVAVYGICGVDDKAGRGYVLEGKTITLCCTSDDKLTL